VRNGTKKEKNILFPAAPKLFGLTKLKGRMQRDAFTLQNERDACGKILLRCKMKGTHAARYFGFTK
jgi:hypothetical protein